MDDPKQTPPQEDGTQPGAAPVEPQEEEPQTPPENDETPQGPDYERKFAESTRQEQIRREQLRAANAKLQNLQVEEPTDEDLKGAFKNYEYMSESERELAQRTLMQERRANKILTTLYEMQEATQVDERIAEVAEDYPGIKGKEKAFKQFIRKENYKGAPLDLLAQAFLHQAGDTTRKKFIDKKVEPLETSRGPMGGKGDGEKKKPALSPGMAQLAKMAGVTDADIAKFGKKQ